MKLFPRLIIGFFAAVVVSTLILYVLDGEDFDLKRSLFTSVFGALGAVGGIYFFGEKKKD